MVFDSFKVKRLLSNQKRFANSKHFLFPEFTRNKMALGKQFNSLTKDIKKALEENCNEINLHCTYLHEYSAYVAQWCFGTKKPFSDPQILYGQFPQKGAKKVKGKNYALFGLQAFLTEFGSLDAMGIVQQAKKLVG